MRECSEIKNFAALILENSSRRYIIYNREMIDSIADPLNRHWDQIAIYLHELAHHLNGNTCNPNDKNYLKEELYADEFSGLQLAKLKANLAQAQHALSIIENPPCDQDSLYYHPCLEKRQNAVANGWYYGMGLENFYKSVSGKMFFDSISQINIKNGEYLETKNFFEYKHCIRSADPCNCNVTLTELKLMIDLKSQSSTLSLKLSDEGGTEKNCNHSKLDTTIIVVGQFKNHINLLPDEQIWIDYVLFEYLQGIRFIGTLTKSGVIAGNIISPDEHGASFYPETNARGVQNIAKITLTPATPP
jgi:hypothetical protein